MRVLFAFLVMLLSSSVAAFYQPPPSAARAALLRSGTSRYSRGRLIAAQDVEEVEEGRFGKNLWQALLGQRQRPTAEAAWAARQTLGRVDADEAAEAGAEAAAAGTLAESVAAEDSNLAAPLSYATKAEAVAAASAANVAAATAAAAEVR